MAPRACIAAGIVLVATSCARSPPRARIDLPQAPDAPDASTGGCARGLLVAGSSWSVVREGTYEGEGCYGLGDPWIEDGALRVRVVDERGGRPMHVAVESERSTRATPDGRALVADFARTIPEARDCPRLTRGIDGVEVPERVDAWELLEVFAAPCRARFQPPVRPDSMDALAARFRDVLKLDGDDRGTALALAPRGLAQRPFGRVRAFAVRGSIVNGGAGMCHSWTTTLRGAGMLYLAEREDVIVEASFEGTATTDEGSCMGCGPDGQLRCPPWPCARGPAKVILQLHCE